MRTLIPINWHNLDLNFTELLDRTDFSRIRKVMEALEWRWRDEAEAPSEDSLRKMAQHLYDSGKDSLLKDPAILEECLDMGRPMETSCGGFTVSFYPRGVVQLSFSVFDLFTCVNDSYEDAVHIDLYEAHRVWE